MRSQYGKKASFLIALSNCCERKAVQLRLLSLWEMTSRRIEGGVRAVLHYYEGERLPLH